MYNNKEKFLLKKKDLITAWLNWMYYFQACYNYERMQGVGFLHAMSPIIKRLYKDDPEERKSAMKRHLQFFNTENAMGSAIIGLVAGMEEQKKKGEDISDEAITSLKTGLMGPLAGIGDTLWQGVVIPLLLVFFIDLAKEGNVVAPILYTVTFLVLYYSFGYWLLNLGYYKGSEAILAAMESGIYKRVIAGAEILGNAVIGGLVANYVVVKTSLEIKLGNEIFNLQTSLFDKIMPGILPLAVVMLCYWLLKKGISPVKVILIIVAIGLVGGVTGIL
ncbi:MAG: PTS system, mannose-specific IID component [Caldanaerobacter subterraneus]|jgi:PTS system mannose-specific IID component|uniref:Mannose permease IID protein n=1 Tax=Caldanaerobacter subterraneus TaxID=911092 RepID=A0A101E498_9THEO|nr:PTS system mannose/fructose/sorbose family transporter subunit IID [Caldanaerobacter subterraneus]KUK08930.1 MAG: PTS system, mannose-specific IID component [Caldanaerobacter subterraneus]HBT49500.1 mannose permease IID protein [Caldanaerobacter subterraneus]